MKKLKLFSVLMCLFIGFGQMWGAAETCTLTSAQIKAGSGSTSYGDASATDGCGNTWNAYAIKNQHSNATSDYHFWQIKKYASNTAYYVQIPEMPGKITSLSITVSSSSKARDGGSNTATLYFSNSSSTAATGTGVVSGTDASSVTIDCSSLNLTSGYITASGAVLIWDIAVTYTSGGSSDACDAPTFSPVAGAVLSGTNVSLTTTTEEADIYYTMGESPADPTTGSTKYTTPISITEPTTIKAIAVKEGLDNSSVASASYTLVAPLATMQDIFNAATNAATDQYITFSNTWVVTGVSTSGKQAYITDGEKGLILFNNSASAQSPVAGLAVGNTLSGTKQCSLVLYGGAAEIQNFTADGLTKGNGDLPNVQTLDATGISNLSAVNTGSLIKISGQCTNSNNRYYIAGVQLYDNLFAFDSPTANANYECTGVYVRYNSTNEICPRSAEDLVQETEKSQPNTYWNGAASASLTIRANESVTALWSTESTGDKHFTSSEESVATIAADGTITIQGEGTTVLTYTTDANNTYYAGTATLTLTVKAALPAGASEFTWDATAQGYTDQEVLETVTAAPNPIIIFAKGGQNDNKYYTSTNGGPAVRFYKDNSITFTAPEGKLLYQIEINFVSGYAQTLTPNVGEYALSGTIGSWSGLAKSVVLANNANAARITSVIVIYADGTETTLSIANIALKTTDGETAIVPTCNLDPIPTIEYSGNDVQVATIAGGIITPVGIGSTTVTARIAQGSNYTAAETTFTIAVAEKAIPEMSFPQTEYNANLGESFTAPTLTKPDGVTVEYSSNNAAVSVDATTGAITLNTEGTAVITATSVESEDYAVGTATYTLHIIDPNKDVLTAAGIGKTSYEDWSKSFTTEIVYAGNSTTGTSDNAGAIQMRVSSGAQDKSGIVTTSTIGYLKAISATRKSGTNYLDVYAKNTAYESAADLYDADKRGALIGTINNGNLAFEEGKAYADNYKYIGIKSHSGAVYYDDITIAWTPVEFTTYSVKYQAGEGATGEEVVVDGIEDGATIQLAAKPEDFSKTDNVFAGWKLNNEGDALAAGSDYTVTGNATFVAQWSEAYTITYKAGDGEGDDVIVENVAAGAYSLAACPNTFEAPEGKIFAGWKLENVEEDTRAAGSSYTVSGSVAFVAQWLTASVVTFEAGTDVGEGKTITKQGITLSVGDGQFTGEDYYQCYKNQDLTIESEVGDIVNITITATNDNPTTGFADIEGHYTGETGIWTGTAANVVLSASNKQVRMTQIVVTYIPNGNTPKQPAGLSYETTSHEIYKGESFDAPTLNNPNELVVTYSGDNDEVATVNAETGAITLGEATGSVTITASAEAQGDYLAGTATYTLTVKEPIVIDDLTGTWTLVTDASQLIAGKKVIIASIPEENAAVTMSTTQAANNRIGQTGATISESVITAENGTAVFTLETGTVENTLAFKSSSDEYLYAASSGKNYIRSQATNDANGSWVINIDEGVATIVAQGTNSHNVMRYNPNNGSPIFACYESTSPTGTLVTLYMLEEETPVEPTYETVRENLEPNRYYTMCLEGEVTDVQGASIWRVVSKADNSENPGIILEEVVGTLDAGRPYIFYATANELKVVYSGTTVEDPVTEGNNGLVGWFGPDDDPIDNDANNYIIYNNELYLVNSDNVVVSAHRAYLHMPDVPAYSNEPQQGNAPRRRVVMGVHGTQTATGMDALNASDAPAKVLIDGQLFILRGEKMYDAKGQLVK